MKNYLFFGKKGTENHITQKDDEQTKMRTGNIKCDVQGGIE